MRVLVMGAGAIGGFVGGLLIRSGGDVTLVARGRQLEALQEQGLRIRREDGSLQIKPVVAVRSPAQADGPFDLVALAVKCYDVVDAARAVLPVLGPGTAVLTLQNGVDAPGQLSGIVGSDHVLPGVALFTVHTESPGVLAQTGTMQRLTLGEWNGEPTPRVKEIAGVLTAAGFTVTISPDPMRAVWEKFALLAPHATISAACQVALGEILPVPDGRELYRQLIGEVAAVARSSGVALPADHEEKTLAFLEGYSPKARASLAIDYERKHRVELEHLTGTVVRRGEQLGVPTPGFAALYAVLKVQAIAFGGLADR